MSTATAFDVKQDLITSLQAACDRYIKDLGHIPADKLNASPMGVARSPLNFTAECGGYNYLLANMIKGEEATIPSPEEREAFCNSIDTFEKGKTLLQESSGALIAALDGIEVEDLQREITAPWGQTMTLFDITRIAIYHIHYHDGQLNYIQSLYGDAEIHWMEE